MVCFDVESTLRKTIYLYRTCWSRSSLFSKKQVALFKQNLTSSYFLWNDQFYSQMEGVTMRSPIIPVIENIFIEHFENEALEFS